MAKAPSTRGTNKNLAEVASRGSKEEPQFGTIPVSTIDPDAILTIDDEDQDIGFENVILKPSNIKEIWAKFKVKAALISYLTWYFRPRNSYDPERVDYNALNILSEFQCFNLEFCKNELNLNDK